MYGVLYYLFLFARLYIRLCFIKMNYKIKTLVVLNNALIAYNNCAICVLLKQPSTIKVSLNELSSLPYLLKCVLYAYI